MLVAASASAAGSGDDVASEIAVKAAFLYNFAKFTEWPRLPVRSAIVVCVAGDDGVATAFVETVRGQNIRGHAIEVRRPRDSAAWKTCQVLFVGEAESRRSAGGLSAIKTLPVLTVSDGRNFSQGGGIIELYVEAGRMRFAINVDAAERSGLHLSSRLLGLAKVVRSRPMLNSLGRLVPAPARRAQAHDDRVDHERRHADRGLHGLRDVRLRQQPLAPGPRRDDARRHRRRQQHRRP